MTLQKLLEKGLPIIFIDNLPNIKIGYDSVMIDNSKASSLAVEHLIKLGHRNIGIITGKQDETTGYERLLGYKRHFKIITLKLMKILLLLEILKRIPDMII